MKKYLITTFLLPLLFSVALAQHYKPVEEKSEVQFKVSHQMIFKSTVTGSFKGIKGTIIFDPKDLSGSAFDVSIDAATISSGISMRDNDLRKDKTSVLIGPGKTLIQCWIYRNINFIPFLIYNRPYFESAGVS